jgi:hypothetical protein
MNLRHLLFTSYIALLILAHAGCSTPPEAKLASTQMMELLQELDASASTFQSLYLQQVEQTQAEIVHAVVARVVKTTITELSADFPKKQWQEKFASTGLIALSEEFERRTQAAMEMVKVARQLTPSKEQSAVEQLRGLAENQAAAMRTSGDVLRQQGQEAAAKQLEALAQGLSQTGSIFVEDLIAQSYLVALVELNGVSAEVPRNLEQLRNVLKALRQTHATVHASLMTDATVSGKNLADLLLTATASTAKSASSDRGGGQ